MSESSRSEEHVSIYHSEEQVAEKQAAILQTSREFSYRVMSGLLNEQPEMLYCEIDSLHQLLTELRRG